MFKDNSIHPNTRHRYANITFVFAARDTERNSAAALKRYLHGDFAD